MATFAAAIGGGAATAFAAPVAAPARRGPGPVAAPAAGGAATARFLSAAAAAAGFAGIAGARRAGRPARALLPRSVAPVRVAAPRLGSQAGAIATSATRLGASGATQTGPKVVFVIGGPGSGKGTQCERLAKKFGFVHLSAGELLREERKVEGSPLKALIDDVIVSGGTVPSEVIASLLEKAMRGAGWESASFVVDGYPRSVEQLAGWQATLSSKVDLVSCLSLEVSREEMRRRLLGRAKTSGRADDNEATIEKRFATFLEETGPLLEHFGSIGKLKRIDGDRSVDEVSASISSFLEEEVGS